MVNIEYIFTDGSCINNGKLNSKGGYSVFFYDNCEKNFCGKQTNPCTNQKGELLGIYKALELASNAFGETIMICTDSNYSINIFTKWIKIWQSRDWKKKDNNEISHLEIIKKTYNLIKKREINYKQKIKFLHINSHKKKPKNILSYEYFLWYGNHQADILARKCLKENV